MAKFKQIAKKLINNKLWKSEIKLIQLVQDKDQNGSIIYIPELTKTINCVISQNMDSNPINKWDINIQFICAQKDIDQFQLDQKRFFKIIYNENQYDVVTFIRDGFINNSNCIIRFICLR